MWRDKEGLTWVSAYDPKIWEYNIRVAEDMARAGFAEIQFDYIRFPEPYRSLPKQVFPTANGRTKQQALAEFLRLACPRVRALGAKCTIDVFGLTTTVPGALEIGQHWESLSPVVDVMLPMTYPSHYPRGAFGIPTFFVGGEMFFGKERLREVEEMVAEFRAARPVTGAESVEAAWRDLQAAGGECPGFDLDEDAGQDERDRKLRDAVEAQLAFLKKKLGKNP